MSCHIGSQLFDSDPMMEAADRVLALIARLRAKGFAIRHADLGGGLGIAYRPDDAAPPIGEFAAALRKKVAGLDLHLFLEPGRSIVGDAGVLLTRVLYRKKSGDKEFVVVDAAMNDLIRPALYDAHHEILPLRARPRVAAGCARTWWDRSASPATFWPRIARCPKCSRAIFWPSAPPGAYGFAQASNYNARPRPAEVLIENGSWRVIRKRETYDDLIRGEE